MDKEENLQMKTYLTFQLENEIFAVNVGMVLSILELQRITTIPQSPDFVLGVINLRGSVLPVIDTRVKLSMESMKKTKDTCIVVVEIMIDGKPFQAGIVVDSVMEVMEFNDDEILPPPEIGAKYRSKFITGMYKAEDHFIMILDIKKVFTEEELGQLQEAQQVKEEEPAEV
jgi:purine-binding chemotaxis protein CheW